MLTAAAAPDVDAFFWTTETFYVAMALAQVAVIWMSFFTLRVPPEENTLPRAAMIAFGFNTVAFFTRDFGMIGVMVAVTVLFLFLVAGSRGEVGKSVITVGLVLAVYWPGVHFIEPTESEMDLEDLGAVPKLIYQGEVE